MIKIITSVIIVMLTGCASKNEAVFVTSTSLSILEADSTPPGVGIGYKRIEGYIGPNNADGTAPPVLASIESDGKVFNPKIRQLYATGNAAIIASGGTPTDHETTTNNEPEVMFFGTSTNIGLSVGTTAAMPDSFNFGYKRKELSVIPLVKKKDGSYSYPSVFASIDNTTESSSEQIGMETNQFFASGKAAQNMAKKFGDVFVDRTNLNVKDAQHIEAGGALSCYAGVKIQDLIKVWRHASDNDLLSEDKDEKGMFYEQASNALNEIMKYDSAQKKYIISDFDRLQNINAIYSATVHVSNSEEIERIERLKFHRNFVCALSKSSRRN